LLLKVTLCRKAEEKWIGVGQTLLTDRWSGDGLSCDLREGGADQSISYGDYLPPSFPPNMDLADPSFENCVATDRNLASISACFSESTF
jgi:hypothetical protein